MTLKEILHALVAACHPAPDGDEAAALKGAIAEMPEPPTAEDHANLQARLEEIAAAPAVAADVSAPLTFGPKTLPDAVVGTPYSQQLVASDPSAGFAAVGKMPAGLTVDHSGLVSGTPGDPGPASFEIGAAAGACSAFHTYRISIAPQPMALRAVGPAPEPAAEPADDA